MRGAPPCIKEWLVVSSTGQLPQTHADGFPRQLCNLVT
jgi:hypothetical protein